MRSVSIVRLLAVCGLLLAAQFRASVAEVSGFGFELLLARLEAFESRINERMDLLSQKMEDKVAEVQKEHSYMLQKVTKSISTLDAEFKVWENSTANEFTSLGKIIAESSRLSTFDEKLKVFEKTVASGFTSLSHDLTEHSSRMNTSMVHLLDYGIKFTKRFEQRMAELTAVSGVYSTKYTFWKYAFRVYRDGPQYHGYGGNWTVFQRRIDGSVDFAQNWENYVHGFGELHSEHWLGLNKLHRILLSERHELLIELEDFQGYMLYAKYDDFKIGSYDESYKLQSIGSYSGTAGDSFTQHVGREFATYDKNDVNNCASRYGGGGWYHNCYDMYVQFRRNSNFLPAPVECAGRVRVGESPRGVLQPATAERYVEAHSERQHADEADEHEKAQIVGADGHPEQFG
uniref:Fibrinogen C-terminal domain-containing protein n=1 Tax=Anopheles farauti TaxID=69004 RepID=A0A182QUH2_9DIPT